MDKCINKPMIIAHRGASSTAPENTLVSARRAFSAGADSWEFDIRIASEGEFVLLHDEKLTRTTDVKDIFPDRESYKVSDFSVPEIKKLDAGSWFSKSDPFGEIKRGNISQEKLQNFVGEEIPTLREALKLTKELNFKAVIEIKGVKDFHFKDHLKPLISKIEELEMEKDITISSFDHTLVKTIIEKNPSLRGSLLFKKPPDNPVNLIRESKAEVFSLLASTLKTKKGVQTIRKVRKFSHRFDIIIWTVNKTQHLNKIALSPLIDGIITDYPARLKSIIG